MSARTVVMPTKHITDLMLSQIEICKKLTILAIFLWLPVSIFAISKRAVIIGLGQYQDKTWSTIHGDRDVPIVKKMLSDCGYTDIATLVNGQATKSEIEKAFASLLQRCKKGDIVYIHYSGHGQQITDISGDEDDGWDEAWIPYDALFAYSNTYKGENHLVDDEIAIWMSKIKQKIGDAGKLLVVVDSCHSGDSLRDDNGEEVFCRGATDDFIIPIKNKPHRSAKTKENWLTLTACRDFQVNCEVKTIKGNYYGMLSYALCNDYKYLKNKTNKEIKNALQIFVDKHRHSLPQDITLTGEDKDKVRISSFF